EWSICNPVVQSWRVRRDFLHRGLQRRLLHIPSMGEFHSLSPCCASPEPRGFLSDRGNWVLCFDVRAFSGVTVGCPELRGAVSVLRLLSLPHGRRPPYVSCLYPRPMAGMGRTRSAIRRATLPARYLPFSDFGGRRRAHHRLHDP